MRTTLALGTASLIIGAVVLMFGCSDQEYSTTSAEAYEHFVQGYRQLNDFQYEEAEASLAKAIQLDPEFAMAHAVLAGVYASDHRTALAKESVVTAEDLAMTLTSDVERSKVQLLLCSLKDSSRARRDSLIAFLLEREPENLLVLNSQATSLTGSDPERAERIFKRIIAIDGNYSPAYNQLGYLAARDGRFKEAESHLVKYAFKAGDSVANPHDSLGEILAMTGKYDEAEREFKTALEIQPTFFHSLLHLGQLYLDQGRIAKGRLIMEKIESSELGERLHLSEEISQLMIQAYYTFELHDEAMSGIRQFVSDYPSSFVHWFYRALASAFDGDFESGEQALETFIAEATAKAVAADNEHLKLRVEAFRPQYEAIVAEIREDYPAARDAWVRQRDLVEEETALQERWRLQLRIGQTSLKAGDPQAALELAKLALEPNPNRIYPMLLLMESARALDEHALARSAEKALKVLLARADDDLPVQERFRTLVANAD